MVGTLLYYQSSPQHRATAVRCAAIHLLLLQLGLLYYIIQRQVFLLVVAVTQRDDVSLSGNGRNAYGSLWDSIYLRARKPVYMPNERQ